MSKSAQSSSVRRLYPVVGVIAMLFALTVVALILNLSIRRP